MKIANRVLNEYAVGPRTTIGRLPDNAIQITNPEVSGHHACVFQEGSAFVVEDLKSTNGTFVNAKRVSRHVLRHGDRLLLGRHLLEFDAESTQAEREAADQPVIPQVEGTVFLDPSQHKVLLAQLDQLRGFGQAAVNPLALAPAEGADEGDGDDRPADRKLSRIIAWCSRPWRSRAKENGLHDRN
jgi:pSer/pThr/pTyr-binding forkhead associated (FHA) protein